MNSENEEKDLIPMPKHTEEEEVAVLSERSPIRLGLILGLFSVAVATIGAAWYLASSLTKIETKLDTIAAQVTLTASSTAILERRVSDHEREDANSWRNIETRVAIIERIGSPKIPELEKKMGDLENKVQLMDALDKRNGKQ